ncbi:septal ring lytic transglycosylase RlpA family protein [Acidithiobacillus concretivorus]|uniref:Endolytic peptidoglycan transglycosylase RlpA n=1 Tax=Acidithiobacillus concretivorus TaxID=3063952 RepID=A0ABS5ZS43_9PROT|nr:septal ring lytic transglycosylase RlpA family protein [Acidithiobacillus concretivorus]MBU2738794.1 septal ring lytic transglycosylase RlpA family protein [Acidithiobacillus concretivorus]
MRLKQAFPFFRLGTFTLAVAALAGCASMPGHLHDSSGNGYGSALDNSAYSTGQSCYAPTPDLNAAYNQPYEIDGQWYHPMHNVSGFSENGVASWYDRQSSSDTTAMGTAFHARQLSAASRTLPLPSCVRVTNLENGRSIVVLVDDRGPFVDGRIMDLSAGAANALGMLNRGTSRVHIQVVPSAFGPNVPAPQIVQVAQRAIPQSPAPQSVAPERVIPRAAPKAIPLPTYTPPANARGNLTAVVNQAFASSTPALQTVTAQVAPPTPAPQLAPQPSVSPAPPTTHVLRSWHRSPQVEQVYLETAQAMGMQRALRERSKLQDFGISTAKLVRAASSSPAGLYKIKIGPMAPTAAPENYASSLERLRLGTFVVSEQAG